MKKIILLCLCLIFSSNGFSQGTAGESAKYENRTLIDMMTAGILEKGLVGATSDILPGGSFIGKIEVGVFDNINFGISYGGSNIIGAGSPGWYKYPGVNLRFRIFNESFVMPALTFGFESQGKGPYFDSSGRYAIKSPGFFGAVSKNFACLGFLSLHGTLNYTLESRDGDNYVDLNVGVEKTIGPSLSVIGEYDFALNDNNTQYFGKGNGYLNMGLRWVMGEGFTLGFDLRDLLNNKKWSPTTADRSIKIEYIKNIFK
jgi:hypothetical protein